MVTPFGFTARWVSIYLRTLAQGKDDEYARLTADRETGTEGKEFARCRIRGTELTVPVAGGAHALKSRKCNPIISEHGKWRREHMGALLTAYGRTPYYHHLMPEIEAVYAGSEGLSLEEFNRRMLDVALSWIEPEALTATLPPGVREEVMAKVDGELSIFDTIFRLGRVGGFGI